MEQVERDGQDRRDTAEADDTAGYAGPAGYIGRLIVDSLVYEVIVGAAKALAEGDPKYSGDRATIPGGRVGSPVYY